jgi:hypothetical protein
MRAAERPAAPALDREAAGQRLHRRRLECFVFGQRRQQAGETRRQHAFSGAGRAHQQDRVQPGRRHLERALDVLLALDVGEVGIRGRIRTGLSLVARQPAFLAARGEVGADLEQGAGRVDRRVAHQRGFVGVIKRQDEGTCRAGFTTHREAHRQRAADRAQLARQRQLAGELVAIQQLRGDLLGRGQNAERDRQVEASGFLRQFGRGQVDGDAPAWHVEARVLQRRAHAVLGLAHFGIR